MKSWESEIPKALASAANVLTCGRRSARSIMERNETLIPARSASSSCVYKRALRNSPIRWPNCLPILGIRPRTAALRNAGPDGNKMSANPGIGTATSMCELSGSRRSFCLPTIEEKLMTFVRTSSPLVIAASVTLVLACSSSATPPTGQKTEAARAENGYVRQRAEAPALPVPSGSSAQISSGTAVDVPRFSTDSCKRDEDCAPVAMCHPDRCASLANAGAMSSEMICSMECRGGTVDCGYNHCGCLASPSGKKLCALLPGAGEKR